MSRYLEMTVEGVPERVGERALRAFRRLGKVQSATIPGAKIEGRIKANRGIAEVTVTWRPDGEGKTRLDISARSDDTLSRAADSALYAYARAYKNVGWPDPEKERLEKEQRQRRLIGIGALLLLALVGGLAAAGVLPNR